MKTNPTTAKATRAALRKAAESMRREEYELTVLMSWTFVDATSVARVHRDGSHGFVASVSALVR